MGMATGQESPTAGPPQPTTLDIARGEQYHILQESVKFKGLMDSAKTSAKRQFYAKKLKKNNLKYLRISQAIKILATRQGDTTNAGDKDQQGAHLGT